MGWNRRSIWLAVAAVTVTSCGSGPSAPSGGQVWEITLDLPGNAATTAAAACGADGACTARSWTLSRPETDGCTLRLDFTAHFTADQVALGGFTRTGDSTCTGPSVPRADSAGQGTADAPYPDARSASGQVTIYFQGVLYTPGGPPPIPWRARRTS